MTVALAMSGELLSAGGTAEDRLLAESVRERGVRVALEAWDGDADWRRFSVVLLRSCWDYHLRPDAFRAWLDRLRSLGGVTWNPVPLVRWNVDKVYLADLAARGAPVVDTRFLERLEPDDAAGLLRDLDATELVVKPSIGATAHLCRRVSSAADLAGLPVSLPAGARWMVQPFLREVARDGEWSLLFYDGEAMGAVLKRAGGGDWRVQKEWGGSAERQEPEADLVAAAASVLGALDATPVYARVDLVRTADGPRLMELELIEPQLFLEPGDPGLAALTDRLVAADRSRP